MNITILYLFQYISIFFLVWVKNSYGKEFIIRFNDQYWNNLKSIINDNQDQGELILRFVDDQYLLLPEYIHAPLNLMITGSVYFIGNKNGTIFDFHNYKFYLKFEFENSNNLNHLYFENIIFQNFYDSSLTYSNTPLMYINSYSDNIKILFNNCIFRDNKSALIIVSISPVKLKLTDYIIQITDCEFYNNIDRFFISLFSYEQLYNYLKVKISHCIFVNNNSIFNTENGQFDIDYCYFTEIGKDQYDYTRGVFYNSKNDIVNISNSVFENIDLNMNYPLIYGEKSYLK
ncbi:hypothetical protein PIROE2DRAFT_7304 [Piromyces sp. E2]|nr:hypothetical protein PIROE2DRAFT_7304 [Piromyces sp. E2]|eukprot:OUM65638.1 hypothetical protein PIROE2DRAFT_7304 [Piromyces sp. E2]